MGATPLFALNLVAWPRETLPLSLLGEVLKGAAEILREAACLMVGGHSVDDPEPKFGMAVIGEVHPDHMLTTAGGCAGDRLVLTKPLGTGILATALKRDALLEAGIAEAVRSMRTLNAGASRAALEVGVSAATDVTGFGLVGHLLNLLEASRVGGNSFSIRFRFCRTRAIWPLAASSRVGPSGTSRRPPNASPGHPTSPRPTAGSPSTRRPPVACCWPCRQRTRRRCWKRCKRTPRRSR